jgi:hypothetical protein
MPVVNATQKPTILRMNHASPGIIHLQSIIQWEYPFARTIATRPNPLVLIFLSVRFPSRWESLHGTSLFPPKSGLQPSLIQFFSATGGNHQRYFWRLTCISQDWEQSYFRQVHSQPKTSLISSLKHLFLEYTSKCQHILLV